MVLKTQQPLSEEEGEATCDEPSPAREFSSSSLDNAMMSFPMMVNDFKTFQELLKRMSDIRNSSGTSAGKYKF